jgi:hypothetical protein
MDALIVDNVTNNLFIRVEDSKLQPNVVSACKSDFNDACLLNYTGLQTTLDLFLLQWLASNILCDQLPLYAVLV